MNDLEGPVVPAAVFLVQSVQDSHAIRHSGRRSSYAGYRPSRQVSSRRYIFPMHVESRPAIEFRGRKERNLQFVASRAPEGAPIRAGDFKA